MGQVRVLGLSRAMISAERVKCRFVSDVLRLASEEDEIGALLSRAVRARHSLANRTSCGYRPQEK